MLLLILAVISCENEITEQSMQGDVDPLDTAVIDQETINELVEKDSLNHEKHKNKEEITQKRSDKTVESKLKNKKAPLTKQPPAEAIVEIASESRKAPLVKHEIVWGDTILSLNYKKKIYPDPTVGCSASSEVFSIHIPINEKSEKMLIEKGELQKCEYTYSYTGGLYGENSSGVPTSGIIKLNQISDEKWKVDIKIQFMVDVMGDIEKNKKIKAFDLSGVFQ